MNDWCVQENGALDGQRVRAMMAGYQIVRPLEAQELKVWTETLQIAALRFWLSRLNDYYFPQSGELTHAKDPAHFERILKWNIEHQVDILQLLCCLG